jgi:ankyrin repeat protein
VVTTLLKRGAQVDAPDSFGSTPLIIGKHYQPTISEYQLIMFYAIVVMALSSFDVACGADAKEDQVLNVVHALIQAGADVNAKDHMKPRITRTCSFFLS